MSVVELRLILIAFLIPRVSEKMRAILMRPITRRLGFIINIDSFAENFLNLLGQNRCHFINTPFATREKLRKHSIVATPLDDVIKHRRGVCQDFAHLGIGCLRALGLAARYVSGYIETNPPLDKAPLAGADASHAWFSVYLPQLGWVDFDPTNNQMPADRHITVAWGRDYADVTPLKGVVFGSGTHELSVSVDCKRESEY